VRAACPAHRILLDLIILIIFGEVGKSVSIIRWRLSINQLGSKTRTFKSANKKARHWKQNRASSIHLHNILILTLSRSYSKRPLALLKFCMHVLPPTFSYISGSFWHSWYPHPSNTNDLYKSQTSLWNIVKWSITRSFFGSKIFFSILLSNAFHSCPSWKKGTTFHNRGIYMAYELLFWKGGVVVTVSGLNNIRNLRTIYFSWCNYEPDFHLSVLSDIPTFQLFSNIYIQIKYVISFQMLFSWYDYNLHFILSLFTSSQIMF
jgi:hypothetical protein